MTTKVIPFEYQGQPVHLNVDGWLHATVIAERFGKEPAQWLRSPETLTYLAAIAEALNTNSVNLTELNEINQLDSSKAATKARILKLVKQTGLVKTKVGAPENGGGTWLHPKLAVVFARWLDARFAVWCDLQIDSLIRGDSQRWQQARSELSLVHSLLCEAVQQYYEAQGRTAQQRHYVNESRLINRVIALMFGARTREQLTQDELKQVARIEARDIQLLAQGVSYEDRKTALTAQAQKQLGGHLHG